jgi:hypothetical protein
MVDDTIIGKEGNDRLYGLAGGRIKSLVIVVMISYKVISGMIS